MRRYSSVKECLDAIERGCIVDQLDNAVPARVVGALLKKNGDIVYKKGVRYVTILARVRYQGSNEIGLANPEVA